MMNTALSAGIGCVVGLLLSRLSRSKGLRQAAVDAALGMAGGMLLAWFVAPISENALDPDSPNVAALLGAAFGALIFVGLRKALRGS